MNQYPDRDVSLCMDCGIKHTTENTAYYAKKCIFDARCRKCNSEYHEIKRQFAKENPGKIRREALLIIKRLTGKGMAAAKAGPTEYVKWCKEQIC